MKLTTMIGAALLLMAIVPLRPALAADEPAAAAPKTPALPPPLQTLASQGAQMRYLGREGGLDGWIAIQNGQEQYFYVTPDQQSFVLGLQFDRDGKVITLKQVQKLQKESGSDVMNYLAGGVKPEDKAQKDAGPQAETKAFKTPSEQLYGDIEASNWIALGDKTAPAVYMFIDTECPYCKKFLKELRANYIPNSQVQVRIIPVGLHENSMAQAAFLLAAPNPQDLFFRHLDGDDKALPASGEISTQGVQRNMAIMQSWKLNATPTTIYRSRSGQVKILQGVAKDIPGLVADLPPAQR